MINDLTKNLELSKDQFETLAEELSKVMLLKGGFRTKVKSLPSDLKKKVVRLKKAKRRLSKASRKLNQMKARKSRFSR